MSKSQTTVRLSSAYVRWGSKSDARMYVAIAGIWAIGGVVLAVGVGGFACLIGVVCK